VSITIAILGLLALIFIHELGHFVAAKAVGMRATRFFIGFPPAVVKFRRGDTEYGIGAIPLGGYVKIVGMIRPRGRDLVALAETLEQAGDAMPYEVREELARTHATLAAALGGDDPTRLPDLVADASAAVEAAAPHLDPERLGWCRKELERMAEEVHPGAYWRQQTWRKVTAIAAGPGANLLAAFVILTVFFMSGRPDFEPGRAVESVASGTPAQRIGLMAGDEIVAVNGAPTGDYEAVRAAIKPGESVQLAVKRDGARVVLPRATPTRIDKYDCDACLGFQFGKPVRVGTIQYGPVGAVRAAVDDIWFVTDETQKALRRVVVGEDRENLTTPVGIVDQSSTFIDAGVYPRLLALISLSLAIFNLLPFLPLDGGHILFALIEKVRRRPVPREVYERVSAIGIAAMLLLFVVGLNNDIGRIADGP
jgi:regulator of sigma E protease